MHDLVVILFEATFALPGCHGSAQTIDAEDGEFLMQEAVNNAVPGIDGDCGGVASCATCHVYVESGWFDRLPPLEELEQDMLDFAFDVKPTSRLSCQIKITADLEGLVVRTPPRQY